MSQSLRGLLVTMRPKQWTKNVLFVFPALVFSANLFQPDLFYRVFVTCGLLILTSGSIYIINDLADVESDRLHPSKKFRPIAAGKLPIPSGENSSPDITALRSLPSPTISMSG